MTSSTPRVIKHQIWVQALHCRLLLLLLSFQEHPDPLLFTLHRGLGGAKPESKQPGRKRDICKSPWSPQGFVFFCHGEEAELQQNYWKELWEAGGGEKMWSMVPNKPQLGDPFQNPTSLALLLLLQRRTCS